jgi:hypothetical protein
MTSEQRLTIAKQIVATGGLAADIARALKLNGNRARQLHNHALQHVSPPPPRPCTGTRHGTANAYRNHGCRCDTARQDNTRYNKKREAGIHQPAWVPSIGVVRRRQALAAIGYGLTELAPYFGKAERALGNQLARPRVTRTTFTRWVEVYNQLSMTPGPCPKARKHAQRMGWAPPLAWNNIDNPKSKPFGVRKREVAA